jgi:ribosomal protein S18 acetylase RimI-like enzyme
MKSCYHIKLSVMNIAIADLCDYYNRGMIITRINVPAAYRGQGHARKLLSQITADADAEHIRLWLEIQASDGLNYDQLQAWYERNGFKYKRGIYQRSPRPQ